MKSLTKLWLNSTFPRNTLYNNAMNKTFTLSPEQIDTLKVLLYGFEELCEQATERHYDCYIFVPDFPGQRPVEKYMKDSASYEAFQVLSKKLSEFENEEATDQQSDFERVGEMFKLSPLHKKLVEFLKPERYDEIFKNIINVMINDVGLINQAEKLESLFVWEETEQGYDYWHKIYFELNGRRII